MSGTSNGESFIYDDNGNMIQRNLLEENTQTLTYDAEGRLTAAEITYTVWTEPVTYTAHYAYDGDGNQVIADVNGDLRLYIGTHFEVQVQRDEIQEGMPWADCFTGAGVYCIFLSRVVQDVGFRRDGIEVPLPGKVSWRSYYLAGGRRIAMRDSKTDEVTWFLSDHLGSTSTTVDTGGAVVGEQRYDLWGGVRVEEGVFGTDYTYTGQRSESALGLMYYVARWYDPRIAHFVQADTIVPGAGNPAAWDRYAYALNNPLKYTDPSGHSPSWCADDPGLPGCNRDVEEEGGEGGGEGGDDVSSDNQFNSSFDDLSIIAHGIRLSQNSDFVPDYYGDYPNDPNVGSDPVVLIDFLLRFSSLVLPKDITDDTFFIFDYTYSESQFIINQIDIISSFEGPGNAYLAGIIFQSGNGPEIVIDLDYVEISPDPITLDIDPIAFSAETSLIVDLVVVCRNCYNTGQGSFTMTPIERIIFFMGNENPYSIYESDITSGASIYFP